MAEEATRMTRRLGLYTIPTHRAFADALAAGLLQRFGANSASGDTGLARGIVIVPTSRARRAIGDAFVRASGTGLLLPRIVAVGDEALDEAVGALFDRADADTPIPPAVAPLERRLILARLVQEADPALDAAEAVRLAGDLARTLDQLLVEEVAPAKLRDIALVDGLSQHWERAVASFSLILERWPQELERLGKIDLAERRSRLLDRVAETWRDGAPASFVCAAGVTSSAPAIARLLRTVAGLPRGMVVLPGIDLAMAGDEWDALGPFDVDPDTGRAPRGEETHPQYHLKTLLKRMGTSRRDVRRWTAESEIDATPARGRMIATALSPAEFTHDWSALKPGQRNLSGVSALEAATPAEEAQAIALALRGVLENDGRTAALVTPDRALAGRVAAHLARWGIAIDDSAGRPLAQTPPGTLLLALAEAATGDFAPLPLLSQLKHPLVAAGEGRTVWLEGVRALDLALRGPRPPTGLAGLDAHFADVGRAAAEAWPAISAMLAPIGRVFAADTSRLPDLLDCLREAATRLCGDAIWGRAEGRAAAELFGELEQRAAEGPGTLAPRSLPALLRTLMDEIAIRPSRGGHPRLAIYGLVEAQMQSADMMVLAGLNEGIWPRLPAPDPWLAPRIRAELGLPGLDWRIGLSAHDLAGALGAPEVLLTRARRDARSPTIASRFWLRLQALAGEGWTRADDLLGWARALDNPGDHAPTSRPKPVPPRERRPGVISVTDVDRLKADPYAFYAKAILRLRALDPVDADPSPAWRGTEVHAILQKGWEAHHLDAAKLRIDAETWLAEAHPMMRALWQPRLMEAIDWIGAEIAAMQSDGRTVLAVERSGAIPIAGVTLKGKFDRIDTLSDGTLGIVDYKTGKPPSTAAVKAGFSLQLGLLGLIAERGGFEGLRGTARAFDYWSLGKNAKGFGYVASPTDPAGKYGRIVTDDFVALAEREFADAAGKWLTGTEPFTAKLVPEFAPYSDYDQLMRRDEWYGRD